MPELGLALIQQCISSGHSSYLHPERSYNDSVNDLVHLFYHNFQTLSLFTVSANGQDPESCNWSKEPSLSLPAEACHSRAKQTLNNLELEVFLKDH